MKTPSIQVNVLESSQSWNVTALSHVNRNAFTSKPHFRSVHGGQDQKPTTVRTKFPSNDL